MEEPLPRIFVTGDLNVDHVVTDVALGGITRVKFIRRAPGGSAYNAAIAFQEAGFKPLLYGKVGTDLNGDVIVDALETRGIHHLIDRDSEKATGTCHIIYFRDQPQLRTIYYSDRNANDYSATSLEQALRAADLHRDDLVFSSLHMYDQTNHDESNCCAFFALLRASGARLIVDIVPHRIYETLDVASICRIVGAPPFMFIGEYRTFMNLIDPAWQDSNGLPTDTDCSLIARKFAAEYFACRYGVGNISHELLFKRCVSSLVLLGPARQTGYEAVPDPDKPGFGDQLTANTLRRILACDLPAPLA